MLKTLVKTWLLLEGIRSQSSPSLSNKTRTDVAGPADGFIFPRTGIKTRNRAVLAAMTNLQSYSDGTLSQAELDFLVMRASLGFGIVTTACAHVSPDGQGFPGELGVFDNRHVEHLRILAQGLHQHGALGLVQIFHGGMRAPQELTGVVPISASANPASESETGYSREASEEDIWRLIGDFTDAAARVAEAGFDGVELHGAHGYLICQFLSSKTNRRSDSWGGSRSNRFRFLFEIIKGVKKRVPNHFLIGVRISPEYHGIALDDSLVLASELALADVDFIHLSCWDSFQRSQIYQNDPRTLTEWFTTTVSTLPPIITAGEVWTTQDAHQVMRMGADLVAVARCAVGNPDWASHLGKLDYEPLRPPFTREHLKNSGLSDIFVHYMTGWKDFVAD